MPRTKAEDVSEVIDGSLKENEKGEYTTRTGRYGVIIGGDRKSNSTILHETGHFLGLSDRYEERGVNSSGERQTEAHEGFRNDFMGVKSSRIIGQPHYDNWGRVSKEIQGGILKQRVDVDQKGYLIGGTQKIKLVK